MHERKLFTEFPPSPTSDWEEMIQKDLKGAEYEKNLIWKTTEGFQLRPYYRAEDVISLGMPASLPGEYPYLRGNNSFGNPWQIRKDIWVDDPSGANQLALDLLNKGITSLGFNFSSDASGKFINEASLAILLKDIELPCIQLNFIAGNRTKDILSLLKNFS